MSDISHADYGTTPYTVPRTNCLTISDLRTCSAFPTRAWGHFRLHRARDVVAVYANQVSNEEIRETLLSCMRLARGGIVQEHHARAWCNVLARGAADTLGCAHAGSFLDDFIVPTPHELRRALSRMAEAEATDELSVLARQLSDARATLRQAQIAWHEAKAAQRR